MSQPVSFLIAGVQKGGTTALDAYLRDHPDVQMASMKEAHFFDDEGQDWAQPDYARYHALFADDGRLRGEATPIYVYWPNSLERIARYRQDMRLILLFRDPVAKPDWVRPRRHEPISFASTPNGCQLAFQDSSRLARYRS